MRAPRGRRRSGSAVVEFSVVLPILVTLLVGVWEVGRLVQVKQIIDNAAREGARCASTSTQSLNDVDTTVKNYLAAAGLKTTGYTVKVRNLTKNPNAAANDPSDDPLAANQLDHLRVTVTLPFNNVKWVISNRFMSNNSTLTSTCDWRCMRDQPFVVDTSLPTG